MDLPSATAESIRVVVRCRPFSKKEAAAGYKQISAIDEKTGVVEIKTDGSSSDQDKKFTFDAVYDSEATQLEVYQKTAKPIVDFVLSGFNGTVFAYGQTGTGKTWTMQGSDASPDLRGLIPNTFHHIFTTIQNSPTRKFLVSVSYLEIYNEEIRDLLNSSVDKKGVPPSLELKEHPDKGVYVKDLSAHIVKTPEEMDRLMLLGNKNRSVGFTLMNAESSRSHSIFTIAIESCETDMSQNDHIIAGKLNLVDLAGSERQGKTGATGDRLKEAAKINLSLAALGNCISALVEGRGHVPYRDSKLTRLLQDSLGGNSKTLMIATMSPADYNQDETISTLRYANRAKNIKNKPKINQDPKDAMLTEFQNEIKRLHALLEAKMKGRAPKAAKEPKQPKIKKEKVKKEKVKKIKSEATTGAEGGVVLDDENETEDPQNIDDAIQQNKSLAEEEEEEEEEVHEEEEVIEG